MKYHVVFCQTNNIGTSTVAVAAIKRKAVMEMSFKIY